MADKNINIKINTTANTAGVSRMQTAFQSLKSNIEMFKGVAGLGVLALGFDRLIQFARSSVTAFAGQETATAKVSAALRNGKDDVKKYVAEYSELASALQKQSKFSDDEILNQMAYARSVGVSAEKVKDYTTAAVGLAARLQVELDPAMNMIIKASNNQFTSFEKAASGMKLVGTNAQKFESMMKFAKAGMSSSIAELDTLDGSLRQLALTWDDTKEMIGKDVVDVFGINKFVPALTRALSAMNAEMEKREEKVSKRKKKAGKPQEVGSDFDIINIFDEIGAFIGAFTSNLASGKKEIAKDFPLLTPGVGFFGPMRNIVQAANESKIFSNPLERQLEIVGRINPAVQNELWLRAQIRQAKATETVAANTAALPKLANPQ